MERVSRCGSIRTDHEAADRLTAADQRSPDSGPGAEVQDPCLSSLMNGSFGLGHGRLHVLLASLTEPDAPMSADTRIPSGNVPQ